jgi:formate dehydrogenase
LVSVRPNQQNPLSQGFMCPKPKGVVDVTYDPDRVLQPLRRTGAPGQFETVSWDEALTDISRRLNALLAARGGRAVAGFIGNPPFFNYSAPLALDGFLAAIKSPWKYCINAEDAASRLAANAILYGSSAYILKPDLWRTHFAVVIGANPLVSHGSLVNEPLMKEALDRIVERGGRVIVVDPRRSETARRFEHIPLNGGSDTWFLLGLVNVLLTEGLVNHSFVRAHTQGLEELNRLVFGIPVARCAEECGVGADVITALARDLAAAPSAVIYGRTGTCTQLFGTLNNLLQDFALALTGNIDRPGGWLFGWGPVDFARFCQIAGLDTFGKHRTRVRGMPDVMGMLPSQGLPDDILEPGLDQIRALVTVGGNPAHTSGAANRMAEALESLDLFFAFDLYVNETNKHAHYVLPVPTFFEREDFPLAFIGNMLRPTVFATEAVITPAGEVRSEWDVLNEVTRRIGRGGTYSVAPLRWLAKAGVRMKPRTMADFLFRTSAVGDWYGLRRGGLSWAKLVKHHPNGKQLRSDLPTGLLESKLRTKDKRIPLAPPELRSELARLQAVRRDHRFPLRLIGRREHRTHNSWLHNVERLVETGRRQRALVNPVDAAAIGLQDGETVVISSKSGSISLTAKIITDVRAGTVSVPHGWGHHGGWQHANAAGGGNYNSLVSSETEDIEALAAMSVLNGIPIRISRSEK